jgi:hypothetical protein
VRARYVGALEKFTPFWDYLPQLNGEFIDAEKK